MSEAETLSEREWQQIARKIREGACVLLLGPAIAVDPDDEQHTPLTTVLARSLADRLKDEAGPSFHVVNRDDLAHVSQVFCDAGRLPGFGKGELETAVEEFYARYDAATTSLHLELAQLPFKLIINTTPDSFMAAACKELSKKAQVDYYDYRHERSVGEGRVESPLVFDLYGSRGDPGSLILTESDLLAFLVNVIRGEPPLPKSITAQLRDRGTTFLYVGFGFERWHVRILLHVLQAQEYNYKSFALETPHFFNHHDRPQTMVFFQKHIGFKLFSWEEFAVELRQHREALIGRAAVPEPTLPATAPLVFLSYFHEDAQPVSDIEEHLGELGIRTWRDSHSLRGGDEWERLIQSVIENVDYVVVIQSCRGEAKVESFVYKEMRRALDRQRGIAPGFRFLIPAMIDRCDGFSELKGLQAVDLSFPGGVAALAAAIKEDWARRPESPVRTA